MRLRRVVTERRRQISISGQHQRQQAAALVHKFQECHYGQQFCITDKVDSEIIAQAVAAHHRQRRQCLQRGVKVGAFGVGMNRLERVRDRLNLAGTPGGVFKPGGRRSLIVILDFFELVVEPLFQKISHDSPQLGDALRIGVGHSGSSL